MTEIHNSNTSVIDKVKVYYNDLRKQEHLVSIVFLILLIPVYSFFLYRYYEPRAIQSILLSGAIQGTFYALIAVGFAIIFGIARMFKLSIGGYFVLGAYAAFWLNKVLFMKYNDIDFGDYAGFSKVPFIAVYYAPIVLFLIGVVSYYVVFDWKFASVNLVGNVLLFVIHRSLIVSKFGSISTNATYQALAIQIGIMAFGLALYYVELTTRQIIISIGILNLFSLVLDLLWTTPKSPALYISILIISVLIVAGVSMLIDRYILEKVRHNQTNVLIITFGVALLIQSAIPLLRYPWRPSELVSYEFIPFGIENKTLEGIVPKTDNIQILDQTLSSLRVVAAIASILILILVYLFISRSRMGKAMKAVSEDPEAAWLVGINVRKVYLISAGLGMGLSAAAGVLTSPFAASPSWGPFMGWSPLIFAIAVVTLGGIGSIFGSVVAGFIVGFTEATIAATDINLSEIVPLIVIFAIIIVRPKGLFGVEENEE